MSEQLQILVSSDSSVSFDGARQLLTVSGELDLSTAPELEQVLRAASGAIVIDCQDLKFIDATGLGVLVGALRQVDSIRLVNVQPIVRRVVTVLGFDEDLLGQAGETAFAEGAG